METSTLLAALLAVVVVAFVARRDNLKHIPSIGGSTYLRSWYGAFQFLSHGREMLAEGHQKYKGRVFKIPHLMGWHVLVSTPELIDELRRAPDEVLSFEHAVGESLQIEYTMGKAIAHNQYHVAIIRSQLTRSLGTLFPEILDEIQTAWNETIPSVAANGWVKMPALNTVLQVVSRTSNRIFIGLPLCRDEELSKVGIGFTLDVVKAGVTLNMVPNFMRPIVSKWCTTVNQAVDRMVDILGPLIEERLRTFQEQGNADGMPVDMLTWLVTVAPEGEERTVRLLAQRILVLNFAATHTSSMSFTHALFVLAANPEYAVPLREEVETVLAQEGWSKLALQKMRKLDSFMRESQRVYGLGLMSMSRKALVDFTFSDGTTVPKGAVVSACLAGPHFDEENYADPNVFDPWRFVNIRAEEGEQLKHQMVHTSADYVTFGYGRHACPGRFFAATELKAMMAHLLLNYDVRAEVEGVVPEPLWFAQMVTPHTTANVLLKKRAK